MFFLLRFMLFNTFPHSSTVSGVDDGSPKPIGEVFDPPETYKEHSYYLSKSFYSNADEAESVCESYDMYLVEINDAGEFKFVQGIARKDETEGLLISGTDRETEGKWIFQFSKEPVKFFDWWNGNPDNYQGVEDYLALYWGFRYKMNDIIPEQRGGYKFMCESEKSG